MKFALITADSAHDVTFTMDPRRGDATSFMQWVSILNGRHYSFEALRSVDNSFLRNMDVVMFSGHLSYIQDIIRIASMLKDSGCVTIFYPEGSTQLYDNSINGFQPLYYEAWRACDILSMAEEDKQPYYKSFVDEKTLVRFIHVPMTLEMGSYLYHVDRCAKKNQIAIYGDNNPNHPLIAMACVNRLCREVGIDYKVIGVETRGADFSRVFRELDVEQISKQSLHSFLGILSQTFLHFYPTEWIGTARQQIACAAVGTPCIGSNRSHTQKRLFPMLAFDIYDIDGMVKAAWRLVKDGDFYDMVVRDARKYLNFYDLGNTYTRFMTAYSEARNKFKSATT